MISFKLNGYSKEEVKALKGLVNNSIDSLTVAVCGLEHYSRKDCVKCPYRKLCNDLFSCLIYLEEKGDSIGQS